MVEEELWGVKQTKKNDECIIFYFLALNEK